MPKSEEAVGIGLINLPAEILLYTFQAVDSVADLKSLILTTPMFRDLWKSHTALISSAVLSRNIECIDEAVKLEEAVYPRGLAIERHKRIISAASLVSNLYGVFVIEQRSRKYQFIGSKSTESECRWSFKRSFYWLWMLVVTSQYKPFALQPSLDPFPLRRKDVLSLCELIIWFSDEAYVALYLFIRKACRIYRCKDRIRCAQSRRWQICCGDLWQQAQFEKIRLAHWTLDLGLRPEPYYNSPKERNDWYRPLIPFLRHARRARALQESDNIAGRRVE